MYNISEKGRNCLLKHPSSSFSFSIFLTFYLHTLRKCSGRKKVQIELTFLTLPPPAKKLSVLITFPTIFFVFKETKGVALEDIDLLFGERALGALPEDLDKAELRVEEREMAEA